jgi:hypothetical protein
MSDDKNRKKIWKLFMPWQYEQEQAWLEEQARQGWLLEKALFFYQFRKSHPQELVYRIDYLSMASQKKLDAYKATFEASGWEYVFSSFRWHYFRIPADEYLTDIYSDTPSKIEQLKRMNQDALLLYLVYFSLFIVILGLDKWLGVILVLLYVGFLAIGGTWLWKTHEKIKTLSLTLDEDERINPEL